MPRSFFGTKVGRVFGASTSRDRRAGRRSRACSLTGMEALEERRLLANIIPSGVISSTPDGANFDYTIALSNSSASNASIGTFWYSWVPGQDYLATSPISVTPPTGWSDSITNMGSGDGFAIQFIAGNGGTTNTVQPGSSMNFSFVSADTPAMVNGNSVFYPGTPVGTSYVYPAGPFSDGGHVFVVAAAPTLQSIAVTPANTSLPVGETEQFTATGTLSNGSTENLTNQVTWASSDTTWATINSTGLATAVAQGPVTISATLGTISGSTGLTVTAAALQSIAVTPANTNLHVGETRQFTATGTLSNESTENLTNQVTWASSDTTWATINSTGLATAVAQGPVTISATLGSIAGSTGLTVTAAALQSIAVTPANTSLPVGETRQFTATGTLSDGSTENLTSQVTWASSDTTWATINSTGLATAVAQGPVTISATLGSISGSTGLTVTAAALQSIAVTPANTSLPVGETRQFTATGTLSDGSTENLTSQVTWASSDTTWATINSTGLATAVGAGPVTISATLGSISGSTGLTVTTAALQSIAVTPANTNLPVGETRQFTATGTLSDGSTENLTSQVTWASSDTTWATINSAGLATAVGVGPVTISATLGSISGSTGLTVTAAALQSIAVTPANTSLPVGETEQFTATGTLSDGSTENLTNQVTWASSDTTWATINSAGLATAVGAGPVTISATLGSISGSTGLTVTTAALQSIAVTPANTNLPVGETKQFTATGTLSDGSTENLTSQVTWASSDTTWATINSAGLATAVGVGPVTISATLGSISGSTGLTVTAAALQSIAVTPANTSLPVGETEQFTATGTLSDGSTEKLTNQVTWASSDTTWATINSAGLATAVGAGPVTISATLGSISGSTGLTVTTAALQSIAVTPANTNLPVGETRQFTATGTLSDGSTENLTSQVTWASSDTTWATINSAGLATAVGAGPVTISATLGSISGSTALTVTNAATVSAVSAFWGTGGSVSLETATDGLRLLPAGRTTDLPWLGISQIAVTLSNSANLTSGDVTVTSAAGINYGPVTISGSGSNYVITLAQPISTADRVTFTIANSAIATYTRRLDVLPGDVNDDGVVNTTDGLLILHNETPAHAYQLIYDVNGDGAVNTLDFTLYRPKIGSVLPPVVAPASIVAIPAAPIVVPPGTSNTGVVPLPSPTRIAAGVRAIAASTTETVMSAATTTAASATAGSTTAASDSHTQKQSKSAKETTKRQTEKREAALKAHPHGPARHVHRKRSAHPRG